MIPRVRERNWEKGREENSERVPAVGGRWSKGRGMSKVRWAGGGGRERGGKSG